MTGVCDRKSKKHSCIDKYKDGMNSFDLALAAKCSDRYARIVIAEIKKARR